MSGAGTTKRKGAKGARPAPHPGSGRRLNAFKHGLAVPLRERPELSADITALAHRIADDKKELLDVAVDIAEAELDLLRVRRVRSELIDKTLGEPDYMSTSDAIRFVGMLG